MISLNYFFFVATTAAPARSTPTVARAAAPVDGFLSLPLLSFLEDVVESVLEAVESLSFEESFEGSEDSVGSGSSSGRPLIVNVTAISSSATRSVARAATSAGAEVFVSP